MATVRHIAKLWVPRAKWRGLSQLARTAYPLETGGVLVGYRADNADLVVEHVIGPGPRATHRHTAFAPDYEWHDLEVARHYCASEGNTTYLGDWHTHPDGAPRLSRRDRKTLRSIARAPAARCTAPVMIVLAGGPHCWVEGIFVLREGSKVDVSELAVFERTV